MNLRECASPSLRSDADAIGSNANDAGDGNFRRAGLHSFAGRIYFKGGTDRQIDASEPIVVCLDAGLDTHVEWAEARARHQPWGSRDKRGRAAGTLRALGTAQALTLQCATAGCTALVHFQAARRQANAADRVEYETGDGCGSRLCSRNHRPGQFLRNQLAMALALESGERLLITWPGELGAREVKLQPTLSALEAAAAARISRMHIIRAMRTRRTARRARGMTTSDGARDVTKDTYLIRHRLACHARQSTTARPGRPRHAGLRREG